MLSLLNKCIPNAVNSMPMSFRTILLGALTVLAVQSSAPSRSDVQNRYSIDRRRRILQQNSTLSRLQLLSPDFCETLTDYECLQRDDHFVRRTTATRKLMQATGAIKPLVLCIQFKGHENRKLPSRENIDFLFNAGPGETDETLLPTGSVAEYLRQNSYGSLSMEADVMSWIRTDNTEAYYAAKVSGRSPSLVNAMHPVLNLLENFGLNFSEYDQDNDGVIDVVIMMHSGYPAEDLLNDCDGQSYDDRIWAHASTAFGAETWGSLDGKYQLGAYVVASALQPPSQYDASGCDESMARIGIVTHELIHTWGLPDLYETNPWGQQGFGSGYYDIMSQPYGLDGTQTYPSNMSPWSKIRVGWLTPTEITHDGEYQVEPSALVPDVYVIRSGFPYDEYLLIENRQPIGFDSLLWDGGLLIWKIDDNVEANNDGGFPGMTGWPGNGIHYRVAVLPADRQYDLEHRMNEGDSGDFWTAGQELTPGPVEYEATVYSQYPNTNSYTGSATGIRIYDISTSQTVMTFKVEGLVNRQQEIRLVVEYHSQ
ncbi:Immune inhibitor A peptidase M6 [Fragilaria crotonensis]|nr:Immune inhibitor A peptidase M6 [Fragilaria crotonensis]